MGGEMASQSGNPSRIKIPTLTPMRVIDIISEKIGILVYLEDNLNAKRKPP